MIRRQRTVAEHLVDGKMRRYHSLVGCVEMRWFARRIEPVIEYQFHVAEPDTRGDGKIVGQVQRPFREQGCGGGGGIHLRSSH